MTMRRNSKMRDARIERHHYTDRLSQPVRSNSTAYVPGSPAGGGLNAPLRRDMPSAPNKRAAYPRVNTMANRRNGGTSMYYRQREGWGQ